MRARGTLYSVVLVGGKGKRLRPLSSDLRPKSFLSVTRNRKTMFRNTIDRIRRMVPDANIIVSANRLHEKLVRADVPALKASNLILEPVCRNTAPAIALASGAILKRDSNAIIMVLPTDHYISDDDRQLACLKKGVDFIRKRGAGIVVIGIKPRHPSTEFGYIKIGRSVRRNAEIFVVERFVEKPPLKTAERYFRRGGYLWNSGIFIFGGRYFMKMVQKCAPEIFRVANECNASDLAYERLPDISIDYAIMEKAKHVYCVKASYGWDDMGTFRALKNVLKREGRQFVEKGGKIVKIL
ncbi:MAG: mannose-1-phosphate guanylyltransferase [Candidatus Omnitrophica bacterium]|nr:mannose-1-phosphate guanylyltransferase [Candidatus Omnitrophota bacterium]